MLGERWRWLHWLARVALSRIALPLVGLSRAALPRAVLSRVALVFVAPSLAALLLAPGTCSSQPGDPAEASVDWLDARPDYDWSFPDDHWSHPGYRTEWWYFTGHLETEEDSLRRFGYQFTLFRVGLLPDRPELASDWSTRNLIMGHASITDLARGEHVFSELLVRETPILGTFGTPGDSLIAWCRAPAGTDGDWRLEFDGDAFTSNMQDRAQEISFTLTVSPEKPRVMQGPNGYSRKGRAPSAASQYYSYTRMHTTGTLVMDGKQHDVAGTSWMDREFGSNQLDRDQVGWDWFSLQLEDGREVMLYLLRDRAEQVTFARGTLVSPDGTPRHLETGDWQLEVLDRWTSPVTEVSYPIRWRLSLPADHLQLEIAGVLPEQENISVLGQLHYWEGAVTVREVERGVIGANTTRIVGRGYVELTGYGAGNRPPI